MMTQDPIRLKASKELLRLPSHPQETHPIWHRMNLLICLFPAKTAKSR
jgi:hypothetical protein